jgi:signal recognition particle subunit SRP54
MASTLSDRLSRLVKTMRGQARITESNVQDMLREVRMALLEADVALPVVRDFIARGARTRRSARRSSAR